MPTRKYISEFGLNMVSGWLALLQQDQIDNVDSLAFSPHIYMICRRKRIGIVPGSTVFTATRISGEFFCPNWRR